MKTFRSPLLPSRRRSAAVRWTTNRHRTVFAVAFAFLCIQSSFTLAATTFWSGSSAGGVFNTDSNWTALAPGHTTAGDTGIFDSTTNVNGTVTFNANISHGPGFISNTSGTISFNTAPFKWTMTSFISIGNAAGQTNTVRLIGGTIEDTFIILGNNVGSTNNSIEVTGAGTLWNNTSTGASVEVGVASNNSTLTVHNGGKVTSAGQTILGLTGASNGRLFVTDTGVLETANYLGVGHTNGTSTNANNNEVDITGGGTVKALRTLMGITAGSDNNRTLVSGAGSTLTFTGVGTTSLIGSNGSNNTLDITSGGAVLGGNRMILGNTATSLGNKLNIIDGSLTGTSIEATRGDVTITNSTVELNDYFNLTPDNAYIRGELTSTGVGTSSITFNSGTVRAVKANYSNGLLFTVGNGGATPATYVMKKRTSGENGTHTFANGLLLNSNAVLNGNGDIVGNVSANAGAQVNVGASPGLINVTGAWNNTGISDTLEVGNLATLPALPGVGYDLLNVAGAFTHGGSVKIDLSSYAAGSGNVADLKILGWTSEVGSSASTAVSFVGGPALPYQFRPDGLYLTNISFSIVPEPASLAIALTGLVSCLVMRRKRF
jgi:T5SS/PEP-CTERM-associated repeat protein